MKPDHRKWIVTTDGKRPVREIASDLIAAEMDVDQLLEELGVVTGSATDAAAAKLRGVAGVVDVSLDTPVDVGPPGSKDTW